FMQRFPKVEPILVFGAHPDDIEFGAGGIIARETRAGRKAHFVVTSSGEAASSGTSKERMAEAKAAAEILGATIE
ncbi:PIG-L family deacetylase, partial [Escherichia coli]|uniref:PIG-L family deacetylase n=1 Tax=Escherichia coli TaxID=562 RepID=UPI003CE571DF